MKHVLKCGDLQQSYSAVRKGERLTITDETGTQHVVELLQHDGDSLTILINNRRMVVRGTKVGDQKHVWMNGSHRRFTPVIGGGAAAAIDPGALSVSIPAVVTEVLVQPNDDVKAGDKLVLLESMKMVLSIQAPEDGTVKAIHCEAGQSVDPGIVLVELESNE
jgi:3-methylcrotonyl-CoA carboxylase alpha subunit